MSFAKTYEEAKARYKPLSRKRQLRSRVGNPNKQPECRKDGKIRIASVVETEATLTKSEPVLEDHAMAENHHTARPRPSSKTIKCKACDKPFDLLLCRIRIGRKYCSSACATVSRKTQQNRTCKECGNPFLINPSQFSHYKGAGQFCSKQCYGRSQVKAHANNPSNDRYGRTSREADKIWANTVKERDNHTCHRCGVKDPHNHAHHVAPRSRRPDLKFLVENGKTLCNSCHTWVHHHPKEATAIGLLSDASYESYAKKDPVFCKVCGSDKRNAGHGYCIKHYKRFIKYGDPLLTKPRGRSNGDLIRVPPEASMR